MYKYVGKVVRNNVIISVGGYIKYVTLGVPTLLNRMVHTPGSKLYRRYLGLEYALI